MTRRQNDGTRAKVIKRGKEALDALSLSAITRADQERVIRVFAMMRTLDDLSANFMGAVDDILEEQIPLTSALEKIRALVVRSKNSAAASRRALGEEK